MAFLAGKAGSIQLAGTDYAFASWTADFKVEASDVTNFTSSGFKENIAGLGSATISARGAFNSAAMAVTAGNSYVFTLKASSTVSYSVTARVTSIKITTDVTKPVDVDISAESNGVFTPSIA